MTKSIPLRDRSSNNVAAGLAALLFILPWTSEAGDALEGPRTHPLTLHDCIAIALGENPALEASRFDVFSAAQEVRAAQGMLLPQLTGSAEYQLFSGSPSSKFAVVNLGNITPGGVAVTSRTVGWTGVELYGARLTYPLFKDGSILGLNNAPAIAEKKAKKQALAWTVNLRREDVIYRISDEFIVTVSARNRMGLAERRVKLLGQSAAITEEQQSLQKRSLAQRRLLRSFFTSKPRQGRWRCPNLLAYRRRPNFTYRTPSLIHLTRRQLPISWSAHASPIIRRFRCSGRLSIRQSRITGWNDTGCIRQFR